jgi:cytochrome c-550 PedF
MTRRTRLALSALAASFAVLPGLAIGHGDVAPQAVDTSTLPAVGEEWLTENPYRAEAAGPEVWEEAIRIGASGYNSNCARCHGLEVVSGGLAPDLRWLEAEEFGDEWYMERYIHGYTQNGITKMPAFGELLGQEAAWAIRTYIETRPDDDSMAEAAPELATLRDALADGSADGTETAEKLHEIALTIETLSGAPIAHSIAYRAAATLDGDPEAKAEAAEILTIGLSAAK